MRTVSRRDYVWMILFLLIGMPIIELAVWTLFPPFEAYLKYPNTVAFIGTAFVVGGRMADAGYRRWIGITAVFAIGVGIPVIFGFVAILVLRLKGDQFWTATLLVVGSSLILLLGLIVWAGLRPAASTNPGLPAAGVRIEPRF